MFGYIKEKKHLEYRRKYRKMYECIMVQHAQIYISVPTFPWRWGGEQDFKQTSNQIGSRQ